ncbi:DUF1810 domain-containing protein [Flavihumibacter sp. R14]|nr:DUF1810 domain-containing protein [Flavihumibacter soli]
MSLENLERFVTVQENHYEQALSEIRGGKKTSHWMWFIFPQIRGLGRSAMSIRYSIANLQEAELYLAHPVLGPRLVEISQQLWEVEGKSAHAIFGSPDDMKLLSSMTLFSLVTGAPSVFQKVLDKYFQGRRDERTLQAAKD